MRIESQNLGRLTAPGPVNRSQGAPRSAPVSSRENLQLSATGHLMLGARQALRAVPEVRADRVQDLSRQMTTGRYQPQPEAIAAAMIEG